MLNIFGSLSSIFSALTTSELWGLILLTAFIVIGLGWWIKTIIDHHHELMVDIHRDVKDIRSSTTSLNGKQIHRQEGIERIKDLQSTTEEAARLIESLRKEIEEINQNIVSLKNEVSQACKFSELEMQSLQKILSELTLKLDNFLCKTIDILSRML